MSSSLIRLLVMKLCYAPSSRRGRPTKLSLLLFSRSILCWQMKETSRRIFIQMWKCLSSLSELWILGGGKYAGPSFFYEVNSNVFIFLIKKGSEWKRGGVTIKKIWKPSKKFHKEWKKSINFLTPLPSPWWFGLFGKNWKFEDLHPPLT